MTSTALVVQDPPPPAYEFGDRALVILPGISWDEWVTLWRTTEGMYQATNFYIGDALLAGQANFGEQFSQVVDAKYVQSQRGAMWVCSRIEPARRRSNLSYSLHRAVAALEPSEQDRWLALASEGGWTVKQLTEALKTSRRGNGGPPLDGVKNGTGSSGNESGTFGTSALTGEDASIGRDTPPSPSAPITEADVQSCIDLMRDPAMVEAIGLRRSEIILTALYLILDTEA